MTLTNACTALSQRWITVSINCDFFLFFKLSVLLWKVRQTMNHCVQKDSLNMQLTILADAISAFHV